MSNSQLAFDIPGLNLQREDKVKHEKIKYNKFHVNNCTFKGGVSESVHQWFRLTPSFGPDLVQKALCKMEYSYGGKVFDPFSGAGTTLIECQMNDIECYGTEINPLLYFVCKTSTEWNLDLKVLLELKNKIVDLSSSIASSVNAETIEDSILEIPQIHNPFRWWRRDVLKDTLSIKKAIYDVECEPKYKDFFMLALAGVLVPHLSNVTLGRLQLHFIDRSKDTIDARDIYFTHLENMIKDLSRIIEGGNIEKPACIYNCDTTEHLEELENQKIKYVVTSPPYPNRYSYVWNTRPHLFMLDLFSTPKEASALDKETIGGTWGTATSILQKGTIEPEFDVLKKDVLPLVEEIREKDNLMANYVMKYFNLLAKQIVVMQDYLHDDCSLAYVVGCSRIKKVYIETDVLLANIIEGLDLGFRISEIDRFRKRHSGVDLHESTVYAARR